MHYNKYYHAFRCVQSLCVLVGLDCAEPMMYLLCMSHIHAFSHAYVLYFSIYTCYLIYFGAFLIASFFPLSILFTLVVFMVLKHKSIPARNPLHFDASFSSDHAPLSLQFCNDDARKAFTENFSQFGIHSECRVILLTPTFPLSFTVENGSLFVTSPSLVLLC